MKSIHFADMSDSELQILLDDVRNEIHKREEIMCITALNRLGRTIKEVQESNFDLNLTLYRKSDMAENFAQFNDIALEMMIEKAKNNSDSSSESSSQTK